MAGKKASLPMKNSKHGAYSKHVRRRYSDKRTTEGKQLAAIIKALVNDCGPDLTAAQYIILDRVREKLIVLMQIGQYVDRQPCVITKEGALLPCLGKGYTTYAESLRRDLEALRTMAKKGRGKTLQEILEEDYGEADDN
jgi:hypothetical protein